MCRIACASRWRPPFENEVELRAQEVGDNQGERVWRQSAAETGDPTQFSSKSHNVARGETCACLGDSFDPWWLAVYSAACSVVII